VCLLSLKKKTQGEPYITIEMNDEVSFQSDVGTAERDKKVEYKADIPVSGSCRGDVKIQLLVRKRGSSKQSLCHFWFNTGFVEDMRLELPKEEIDVANKERKGNVFTENFHITVYFKDYDPEDITEPTIKKKQKKRD